MRGSDWLGPARQRSYLLRQGEQLLLLFGGQFGVGLPLEGFKTLPGSVERGVSAELFYQCRAQRHQPDEEEAAGEHVTKRKLKTPKAPLPGLGG